MPLTGACCVRCPTHAGDRRQVPRGGRKEDAGGPVSESRQSRPARAQLAVARLAAMAHRARGLCWQPARRPRCMDKPKAREGRGSTTVYHIRTKVCHQNVLFLRHGARLCISAARLATFLLAVSVPFSPLFGWPTCYKLASVATTAGALATAGRIQQCGKKERQQARPHKR